MRDTYEAVCCIGRQPNSDVWVLGENLQLNGDGVVVTAEETSIIWVKAILESERTATHWPEVTLPLCSLTLGEMVESLMSMLHHNGIAAVFTIGKLITICSIFWQVTPVYYKIADVFTCKNTFVTFILNPF